jgi:RimJ/RimL family protein N-acetyltransferase
MMSLWFVAPACMKEGICNPVVGTIGPLTTQGEAMTSTSPGNVRLVPYSRYYLDCSWQWLNDPEIKRLTLTPDFSREDQDRFFASLPTRADYRIWGLELEGTGPIGAAGLKNLNGNIAEYWGYIGSKAHWGRGLGRQLLTLVENEAIFLGLEKLALRVARFNVRAIGLYRNNGYVETGANDEVIFMEKDLLA